MSAEIEERLTVSGMGDRFGFNEGVDDRLPIPAEEESGRIPTWQIWPLTSVICAVILLALGFLARAWVLLPAIGSKLSFVLSSIVLWLLVQRCLSFSLRRYQSQNVRRLIAIVNRSTGIKWVDYAGIPISLVFAIVLLLREPILCPYPLFAMPAFFAWSRIEPVEWPTRPRSGRREKLPEPTEPDEAITEEKNLRVLPPFAWQYHAIAQDQTHTFSFRLAVDKARYASYQSRNPFASGTAGQLGYAALIKELVGKGITPEVEQVAANLVRLSEEKKLSPYDEVNNVLAFLGTIPYSDDPGGADYWRYPIETLMEKEDGSDCDCHAILAAAIYWLMGYECIILIGPGHMACAVSGADGFPQTERFYRSTSHGNRAFFYCETTNPAARAGEIPEDMSSNDFQEYEIC